MHHDDIIQLQTKVLDIFERDTNAVIIVPKIVNDIINTLQR